MSNISCDNKYIVPKIIIGTSYRSSNQQFRNAARNVRLGDLFVGFLQVQVNPKIQFGYAYNAPMGMQGQVSSHEITLKYRFTRNNDDNIIINPRDLWQIKLSLPLDKQLIIKINRVLV